jgi:cysteine synthase
MHTAQQLSDLKWRQMRRLAISPLTMTIVAPFLVSKISSSSGVDEARFSNCKNPRPSALGLADSVGKTPLIYLSQLSAVTGCHIYGKCEYMNPTGSVKDRAAAFMLEEAERSGKLLQGGIIVEGTGGNTGISLAQIGRAKGYHVILCMPHNIAKEKIDLMKRLGAEVHLQPSVPFSDPRHYAQLAASLAKERGGFHTNQFENLSNYRAHVSGTGPEVWEQSRHRLDVFVTSAGTGGTLAGVSSYLKQVNPQVQCYLADPHGSSLFHYVLSNGQSLETVGKGSVMEGIGINRITENFKQAKVLPLPPPLHSFSSAPVLCPLVLTFVTMLSPSVGWRGVSVRCRGGRHGILSSQTRGTLCGTLGRTQCCCCHKTCSEESQQWPDNRDHSLRWR